ncbi:MAG: AraC family transcriptional regulator [Desulfovibrio sp.]|uniref:AraC family transcriptional regulator n=1 Tax=Desulfovibrio sp. 7SRBS1 TaxID=3378064 RepID=UPI003B4181D9
MQQDKYTQKMLNVLLFIQQHLDDPLDAARLAEICGYSPSHFHRVFKGMVGETLKEHIRRLRLERAALRLLASEKNVTDIAFGAGYETHEAFSRAFKQMFGKSPSAFRNEFTRPRFPEIPSGIHFQPENISENIALKPQGGPIMNVEIKQMKKNQVAFIRHTGPYAECRTAWEALCNWAGPKGLFGPDTRFIGACYDDPSITAPEKIRMDVCLTLSRPVEPEGQVGLQEIGGFECAVYLHKGPYEQLEKVYAELFGQWLPQSGREAQGGPSYEVYLNDCTQTTPEELLTEIWIPLK